MHRTHGAEVADVRVIWSLRVGNPVGEFRDHEIKIGVPLAVRVGGLIDRHIIDIGFKIRAVIQVIASQQVLVGFAFATVQCHDQAGNGFE